MKNISAQIFLKKRTKIYSKAKIGSVARHLIVSDRKIYDMHYGLLEVSLLPNVETRPGLTQRVF